MCAKPPIEWFDRVAFGEGDVGRVFRGGGAVDGDARLEEGRSRAPDGGTMEQRQGRAVRSRPWSSEGPVIATPTTIDPSTAAVTVAPSAMAAPMRVCPAAGSDGAMTRGATLSRSHAAESGWMITGCLPPGVAAAPPGPASEFEASGFHHPRSRAT